MSRNLGFPWRIAPGNGADGLFFLAPRPSALAAHLAPSGRASLPFAAAAFRQKRIDFPFRTQQKAIFEAKKKS